MTKLKPERRAKRETWVTDRSRPIVIELFPFYCSISLKGKREFHAVPWEAILDLGRKLDARAALLEKKRA